MDNEASLEGEKNCSQEEDDDENNKTKEGGSIEGYEGDEEEEGEVRQEVHGKQD